MVAEDQVKGNIMYRLMGPPKTVKVTKKLSTEYANMTPAPRDRPLSERRLMVYERVVNLQGFRPVAWAKAYCKETGEWYRVNGKHTSTLFSGMESLPELYAVIEEFECDTLEDVAKLYSTYDSKMQSRTTRDINMSFAGTMPELTEVPGRVINLTVSGLSYHLWQDKYSETPAPERAELLLDHGDFCLFLNELIGPGASHKYKHLARLGVAAAIFGGFKKAKGKCFEFWSAVRDETDTKPDDMSRQLARFLLTTSSSTTRFSSKEKVGNHQFYVMSIKAWNAWRNNKNVKLRYSATEKTPAFV